MKISLQIDKKSITVTAILSALALILLILTRYQWWIFILFCGAVFLLKTVELRKNGEIYSGPGSGRFFTGALLSFLICYFGTRFTTFCIQYIILEPELYKKTKKNIWKLNILCVMVVYLLILAVVAEARWTFYIAHCFFVLTAFVDYFVYEFRQNEITFGDLTTIDTGLSVAKAYRFTLHDRGAVAILLTILAFMLLMRLKKYVLQQKWWQLVILAVGVAALTLLQSRVPSWLFVLIIIAAYVIALLKRADMVPHMLMRTAAIVALVLITDYLSIHALKIATQTWEKKGTYKNGFVLNFVLGYGDSKVKRPAGYSEESMTYLEEKYSEKEQPADVVRPAGLEKGQKPTIITIMNESFSDLRLLGDLTTNMEVTPFLDSLQENTVRGYTLSSVFGAKTPNSEWEYLSGGSLGFLPSGAVVYQQYMGNKPTTLVSTLKNEGYTAVAMHPYFKAGWRRNTVYPKMGFNEMSFLDTGGFDETRIFRDYVKDEELYDKIIERFENKGEDENLFILGITMQNHGGYKEQYPNFVSDVHYDDGTGNVYADADLYLSLIHQTDIATEKLIKYFEQVDEPVEIVFFGDHLPSLSNAFFRSLNGKGVSGLTLRQLEDLFSVPFFIWTNYDSEEETIERTSLNYLSTMTLERAGIDLPPYNMFLHDLRKTIPAINSRGYYSLSENNYLHLSDAMGSEASALSNYRILQYNMLFDDNNRSSVFFPYIKEEE